MIWRFFPISLVIKPNNHVKKKTITEVRLKKPVVVRDKIIPGAIIGVIADVVKLTVNLLGYLLGFTPVVFWQLIATRFLDKKHLFSPFAYVIGGAADLIVASMMGVVFIYFIHYFPKFIWLKGIGFGLTLWVSLFGILMGQSLIGVLPREPSFIMVTLVAHFFFGLSLAFFAGMLHRKQKI